MSNTLKRMFSSVLVLSAGALFSFNSSPAHADVLYFNGFEPGQPGSADFYDSYTNAPAAPPEMTIVPSGTNGINAASGNFYAQIENIDDNYSPGVGESVYTDYGATRNMSNNGVTTNQPFYESTDYYINTAWAAAPAATSNVGFWIDTSPGDNGAPWPGHAGYTIGYADETNFRIADTGNGAVSAQLVGYNVSTDSNGNFPSVSIPQSGWYTFKTTFEDDGGYVANTLSVLDSDGNTLGSATQTSSMPWADLTGTGYGDWTTVWADGFANDTLAIDNVTVGTVPEPTTLSLLGVGSLALLRRKRRTA